MLNDSLIGALSVVVVVGDVWSGVLEYIYMEVCWYSLNANDKYVSTVRYVCLPTACDAPVFTRSSRTSGRVPLNLSRLPVRAQRIAILSYYAVVRSGS